MSKLDKSENKQLRVNVSSSFFENEYRQIKSKLALRGSDFSKWVREKIMEELNLK